MKKLLSLTLVFLLLTAPSLATMIDFSTLSDDQLLTHYAETEKELRSRGAYPYVELKQNDKSDEVAKLQRRLNELGYFTKDASGKYDSNTTTAMKAYEKAAGLKLDGIASVSEQTQIFSEKAIVKPTPTPKPTKKPTPTPKIVVKSLDLKAINNTNSAASDAKFVGKSYRITGIIDWVAEPSDGDNALIVIQPDVMAKGMASMSPLEINIWLTPDEFDKIGGNSSAGKYIDITAKLTDISRNSLSNKRDIKGYPIQLEFGEPN